MVHFLRINLQRELDGFYELIFILDIPQIEQGFMIWPIGVQIPFPPVLPTIVAQS